jgi:hypothetical protein
MLVSEKQTLVSRQESPLVLALWQELLAVTTNRSCDPTTDRAWSAIGPSQFVVRLNANCPYPVLTFERSFFGVICTFPKPF